VNICPVRESTNFTKNICNRDRAVVVAYLRAGGGLRALPVAQRFSGVLTARGVCSRIARGYVIKRGSGTSGVRQGDHPRKNHGRRAVERALSGQFRCKLDGRLLDVGGWGGVARMVGEARRSGGS